MPEQPATSQPSEHSDVGYEATDAKLGPLVAFGVGIVLLGLVAHGVCWWMFEALRASTARHDPGLPALAAKERPQLPKDLDKIPQPRLQVDESLAMDQFRRDEDARLNSYGWTDAKIGTVHIPIAEAMRLLANPVEPAKNNGGER